MPSRLTLAAASFLLGAVVAAQAATITVAQRGLQMSKSSLDIARGDRVIFNNDDDVIHNIHIFGPDSDKDLGLQKPGKPLSYVFDKSGAFRVRCNIHPSIKMAVNVK